MKNNQDKTSNVTEYNVTEISQSIKNLIENGFSNIKVRGEISNLKIASSGHAYMDLKDDNNIISAICWKWSLNKLAVFLKMV